MVEAGRLFRVFFRLGLLNELAYCTNRTPTLTSPADA